MSTELIKARQALSRVGTLIKQEKLLPAAQSMQQGLSAMLKNPLMKAEREEFESMIYTALGVLNNSPALRKIYPLTLNYQPGTERQLLDEIKELVAALDEAALSVAQEQLSALERAKQEKFARGQAHLDNNQTDEARGIFLELTEEHPEDAELHAKIGDSFLKAGFFDDAVRYLDSSLTIDPGAAANYNRIGIALRRQGKYPLAEQYYFKALKFIGKDPGILFNMGRLYIEWGQWDSAVRVASEALAMNPGFVEARKLLEYAQKQGEAAHLAARAEAEKEGAPQ